MELGFPDGGDDVERNDAGFVEISIIFAAQDVFFSGSAVFDGASIRV